MISIIWISVDSRRWGRKRNFCASQTTSSCPSGTKYIELVIPNADTCPDANAIYFPNFSFFGRSEGEDELEETDVERRRGGRRWWRDRRNPCSTVSSMNSQNQGLQNRNEFGK